MEFKEMLAKLLKEKNDTAYKLANATGISQGLLSDYKNGRSKPTIENIIKISKYFDISTDYLLGLTNDPTPSNKKESSSIESEESPQITVDASNLTAENIEYLKQTIKLLELTNKAKQFKEQLQEETSDELSPKVN